MNKLNEAYTPTKEISETHRKITLALLRARKMIATVIGGEVDDIEAKVRRESDSITFYGFMDIKTENATYSISYDIFEGIDSNGNVITRRSPIRALFPTLNIFTEFGSKLDINERAKVIKSIADICQKEFLKVGLHLLHSYEHTSKDFEKFLIKDTKNKYLSQSKGKYDVKTFKEY
jgi:hypothetical protein